MLFVMACIDCIIIVAYCINGSFDLHLNSIRSPFGLHLQAAWEDNRLLQSGVAVMREVATEFDTDEDSRITLIVHNLKVSV